LGNAGLSKQARRKHGHFGVGSLISFDDYFNLYAVDFGRFSTEFQGGLEGDFFGSTTNI
jgi:hypothetical protein